jgi:GLPGLI family protein
MKKIVLVLGIVVCFAAAEILIDQIPEGVINYEVKVNVHRTLPKEREAMKNRIPEFRTSQHQLFFNPNESLYKPVEEEDEDENMEQGGGGIRMRFQQPRIEMYFDQATARRITQQEFMGKEYLIEDSLQVSPWKFGTETKTVIGYECKQAMYYNEERNQQIVAWYTQQLRPFLGPETFNTLPGAVLEVNLNDGERILTAKSVEPRPLKKYELKIPRQGIKTTQAEFKKMMEEHRERMRESGGNVIIR